MRIYNISYGKCVCQDRIKTHLRK